MNTGLYIHVPWCRRRCPYCNFYFEIGRPKAGFVEALLKEWNLRREGYDRAATVYFGGGTPSLLQPSSLNHLIQYLSDHEALLNDCEITLEVNPEDINDEYVSELAKTRVSRISMGVQSFDDEVLASLGRKHTSAMAKDAIACLMDAGFTNISIDLILGTTLDEKSRVVDSIDYLNMTGIPHISTYLLTIEENTQFFRRIKSGKMRDVDEDSQVSIYQIVQSKLADLGFLQYDISSYARPGFFSRHNQIYWASGSYLGLGPSSHSMQHLPDGGVMRVHNQTAITHYLNEPTHEITSERLAPEIALYEALAFGLRNMMEGISPEILSKRHQTAIRPEFFAVVEKYKKSQWLVEHNDRIAISQTGALFADAIMRDILTV